MTTAVLVVLNLIVVAVFVIAMRKQDLLGYAKGGKWYLTWLSIGVITLMDELTSVFYAPAEAHRFIGTQAIFFIAFTSLLMRLLSSRMVEIAQILELNDIRGGGVYSFSYLVLGPVASFVAVASIMVDYILTACISTVSAVINGTAFIDIGSAGSHVLILAIIWGVAGLNILGIRENARVTFGIFIAAAFVFVNLIALGFLHLDPQAPGIMWGSVHDVWGSINDHSIAHAISIITVGVASCVLAYSGIESVIQTAGLVENWRAISKAYWFLALTVGIVTPVLSALALSAPIDFHAHEGDLIPHYATLVGNVPFGVVVGLFGSVILIMAVNTAYVASSELLERVAHRYNFEWLVATNRRASLYRVHIINGVFYTAIIQLTGGSQNILAEMYAIGLLASFCLNIGCLLIYRYSKGTKDIRDYYTSRTGDGWCSSSSSSPASSTWRSTSRTGRRSGRSSSACCSPRASPSRVATGPSCKQRRRSDYPLDMILVLAEADDPLHVYFRRPGEHDVDAPCTGNAYVTFFSPRQSIPDRLRRASLPLPDPGRQRLSQHQRRAGADRGRAGRSRRDGPLRLADVVVDGPHRDRRAGREDHAAPERPPAAAVRDRTRTLGGCGRGADRRQRLISGPPPRRARRSRRRAARPRRGPGRW